MCVRRAALLGLFLSSVALSAPVSAAPFVMRLGPDRLVLDAPPGFSDTAAFSSPRLAEIAETLTDAANRVLLFALADVDARRFSVGDPLELRRYMVIATPRAAERNRIGPEEFAATLREAARELAAAPPEGDFMQYLQARKPGQAHLLAQLKREPQLVSILQGTMLPRPEGREHRDKPPVFRLSTETAVLVAGKALYVSVISAYETPADVTWIRTVTERWIQELQRLNR